MAKNNPNNKETSDKEKLETILSSISEQHQEWIKFLSSLTIDQAKKPIYGSWSVIDTFIHITSWKENALKVSKILMDNNAPDPAPRSGPAGYLHIYFDKFNYEVYQTHKDWTISQAIEWGEKVNNELIETLRKLPYKRTLGGISRAGAQTWYWMPSFIHTRGHRNEVIKNLHSKGK